MMVLLHMQSGLSPTIAITQLLYTNRIYVRNWYVRDTIIKHEAKKEQITKINTFIFT